MAKATKSIEAGPDNRDSAEYRRFTRVDEIRRLLAPIDALLEAVHFEPNEAPSLDPEQIWHIVLLAKKRAQEASRLAQTEVNNAWGEFQALKGEAATKTRAVKAERPKTAKPHWKTRQKQEREAAANGTGEHAEGGAQ